MRLHYLQHVAFEDAANIARWAVERGHQVSGTRLFAAEPLPSLDSLDWLAVMGGPMNIYQHDEYPWLVPEKEFIRLAIEAGKSVLGVCLGAQLAADVLGGKVVPNRQKEIGWYPVTLTEAGTSCSWLSGFPTQFLAFHWHGDTFEIPPGAAGLASSEACHNQAFQYGDRVLGLQFHLDYSCESLESMLRHCSAELVAGPGIQQAGEILPSRGRVEAACELLYRLLDCMEQSGMTHCG